MTRSTQQSGARKTERLLDLLVVLLGARHPLAFSDLRAQFLDYDTQNRASGVRTFERDKQQLLLLGVPLRCVPKGTVLGNDEQLEEDAYEIDREQYLLPVLDLEPDELAALAVVAEVARTHSAFPYRQEIDSALRKISFDRGSPEPPTDVRLDLQTQNLTRKQQRHLGLLEEAVRHRKRVEVRYLKRAVAKPEPRTLDPYGLVYRYGRWLLVGHCHTRAAPRTFRVDRLVQVKVAPRPSEPDFERPAGLDLRRLALRSPWTYEVDAPIPVVLETGPDMAVLAREDFGESSQMTPLPGGGLRIAFSCQNPAYVVMRVLRAAGSLRVVQPSSLQNQVRDAADAALRAYR